MKCSNCSNELGQDEVFCGQCGAPNAVPAQQTEMMPQAPASPAPASRSGMLGSTYRSNSFLSNQSGQPFASENMPSPGQSAVPQGPQQSVGFHQDATEAFSNVPGTPANYAPGTHPQQSFPGNGPMPGGYTNVGQFGTQQSPLATGNFVNPNSTFPPTQMGFSNSGFGPGSYSRVSGTSSPSQQQRERNNMLIIVGIVCLVIVIILAGTFATLFALHGNNGNNNQTQATVAPTAIPTATPSPTPSPIPSPTPTIAPTPTPPPDSGFSWCTQCTPNGFRIEFPNGWSQSLTYDQTGTLFTATQPEIFADVKTPSGAPASATDLINTDMQQFKQTPQANAQANSTITQLPTSDPNVTIGGQNWTYQAYMYQDNSNQPVYLYIYATINQGKGYVIEQVAPQSLFPTMYGRFFTPMLKSFQFVALTHQ